MAQRYIFKCKQCDVTILVESTQAGQSIKCTSCESTQKLGTLREIKALPPEAGQTVAAVRPATLWSPQRRGLFVFGGVALVLGALVGGYSTWKYSQFPTQAPNTQLSDVVRQQIENLSPAEMLSEWDRNAKPGAVDNWAEPEYLKTRKTAQRFKVYSTTGWVVAGIGLIMLLASLLMKNVGRPHAAVKDAAK